MRAPVVLVCAGFVLGIVLPELLNPLSLLLVSAALLVVSLGAAWRRRLRLGTASVAAGLLVLGNLAGASSLRARESSELEGLYVRYGEGAFVSPRLVTGTLRREPERLFDQTRFDLDVRDVRMGRRGPFEVDPLTARGGLSVRVHGDRRERLDELVAGDRVRLWARIRKPSFFRNPGGFDGAAYLARRRIALTASVKSGRLVMPLAHAAGATAFISRLRLGAKERLDDALPDETVGVVSALVTGDRSRISSSTSRLYRRAGIFHVMAISGAHVAIWILALHVFLRFLGFGERATLVTLGVVLPVYAVFCGGRAPIVRAVVMASVVIGARLLSLKSPLANGVALAALALLAWEPSGLTDPGFQLTFAAMGTIGLFAGPLAERFARLGPLATPLGVSVAAQIGVAPIAAFHFQHLSPLAPLSSLVAMPVAAVVCVSGVLVLVVSGVPWLLVLPSFIATRAAGLLTGIAAATAALPCSSLRVGAPTAPWLGVYVGAVLLLRSERRRWCTVGWIVWVGLLVQLSRPTAPGRGVLELTALDVGHGDAILVTLPEGQTLLVDGGGLPYSSLDVGESVVLPYVLQRGVRHLDAVLITHTDFDHAGGLVSVIDEIAVGAIWEGAPDGSRTVYRELRGRAAKHGIAFRRLTAGESFEWGGAGFEVLASGGPEFDSANDRSVVLRLAYGGRRVLLTGDAEAPLERELLRRGVDLRADVLKVAHHGSRSSTSARFLDAVRPRLALVSARRSDIRPLPSPRVLHRLRTRGIEYARTDKNGAVTVRIYEDGRIELTTYRQAFR